MKERLTGALILVALFVIVVPEMLFGLVPEMLFGQSWRRADGNVPAADGPPVRSYTMELGGTQTDQSALAPQTAARAAAEAPAAVENEPATPVPTPTSPEPAASSSPALEKASEPVAPAVATPAAPVPAPSAPAAPAAGNAWWVQAGSFSQSANAQRVVRELGAAGITARVSSVKSNGKELFRVRAGPVADRAAAEALRQRMAAVGHKGSLVPP